MDKNNRKTFRLKNILFVLRIGITLLFVLSLLAVDFSNPKDILSLTTISRIFHPNILLDTIASNLSSIIGLLKASNVSYIIVAFFIHLFCVGLLAVRWKMLLKIQNISISFFKLYLYYLIGFFFNNFLPTNVGGDVSRVYNVGKSSGKITESFAVVFFERFIGFITIFLLAFVSMLFHTEWFSKGYIVFTITVFLLSISTIILVVFNSKIRFIIKGLISKINFMNINRKLTDFYKVIYTFKNHTKIIIYTFVISIIYQLLLVVMNWFAASAVGISVTFMSLLFALQISTLICLVPISVNGLGVRETLYVKILGSSGISSGMTLTFQVIMLVINYVESLVGGICFLLVKNSKKIEDEQ